MGARGEDFHVSLVPAGHTLDTRCPCYAGVRIMGLVDRKVRDGRRPAELEKQMTARERVRQRSELGGGGACF